MTPSLPLAELIASFEQRWPLSHAEEWDAPGLITGNGLQQVTKVLLTVDVTAETVKTAIDGDFNVLLAHHPYIMRGVKTLAEDTVKGAVLAQAVRAGLAIYAAHTNADVVENGVSHVLATKLGLQNSTALEPLGSSVGSGRLGMLPDTVTLGEFALAVARALPATATGVRVSGEYDQPVNRVAVCGGAGDSFIGNAVAAGADVYVTADLRHHVVQDVREQAALNGGAPAIIDVSHWASEWLWLEQAAAELRNIHTGVEFEVCDLRTDPWDFVITQ
jgi:dinuclear metal center YbgI/SA1388 family protein